MRTVSNIRQPNRQYLLDEPHCQNRRHDSFPSLTLFSITGNPKRTPVDRVFPHDRSTIFQKNGLPEFSFQRPSSDLKPRIGIPQLRGVVEARSSMDNSTHQAFCGGGATLQAS
jgi:hypothetical protein